MRLRAPEFQPAVRTAIVVMLEVVSKDCLHVARSDDQDPIEAFGLDRLHPPLCEGVGARCLDRRADDIDTLSYEDHIEATAVLDVPIVDEESHGRASILQAHGEVAGLLSDPHRVGAGSAAGDVDSPGRELDEEEHIESRSPQRVDGEEVRCEDGVRLCAEEFGQVGPARRGAGPRPLQRKSLRIVIADTSWPSLRSSPRMRL
jgi:hypothetical protein